MTAFDITLVTYSDLPRLAPDDRLLSDELSSRGLRVRAAIWSDDEVDWSASKLTVLRSTWDYFHHVPAFLAWLTRVELASTLVNRADVVRWNHDKRYLNQLSQRGVPVVPTRFVERGAQTSLRAAASALGASEVVVKPAISGAAFGARRFDLAVDEAAGEAHLNDLCARGTVMVQPFISSVLTERERSLVLFDGDFSHGFLKAPFNAGAVGGESAELAYQPSAAERDLAKFTLDACGFDTAYARVDLAPTPDGPLVMEVELIEPALKFGLQPGSAASFGDVVQSHLERLGATRARALP